MVSVPGCIYSTFVNKKILQVFAQNRIIGGTVVLGITQFLASLAGLFRDRALTLQFPDLLVVDAYISSFRVSDLLFQMFIMAGFSVALVPLLAEQKSTKNSAGMLELLSGITTIAAIFFALIAIVVAVFFPSIAPYITDFSGEQLELYITFGRLALVSNFLFIFGNAFGQYLITVQRYWIYGLTPVLYSIGTIIGTKFLSTEATFGNLGPMVGSLLGALVYAAIRMIIVFTHAKTVTWKPWHHGAKEAVILMIPRTLALGTLQLQLLLFDKVASGLTIGSVTINAYARNFQSVAVGIAGIALAQSAFSLLSQSIANKEISRFWIYMKKGLYTMLAITIPGAIALVIVAPLAARIVGIQGNLFFVYCLSLYAISIPFESANHLLLRGYYASKQTAIPAFFSVISGVIAITTSWVLAKTIGVFALPIGFGAGQIFQLIGLSLLLPKAVKNRAHA